MHGYITQASEMAVKLAREILNNPEDLVSETSLERVSISFCPFLKNYTCVSNIMRSSSVSQYHSENLCALLRIRHVGTSELRII